MPAETITTPKTNARDLLFGDLSGLHSCPIYTARRLICGCAHGQCQQAEADLSVTERHGMRVVGDINGVTG